MPKPLPPEHAAILGHVRSTYAVDEPFRPVDIAVDCRVTLNVAQRILALLVRRGSLKRCGTQFCLAGAPPPPVPAPPPQPLPPRTPRFPEVSGPKFTYQAKTGPGRPTKAALREVEDMVLKRGPLTRRQLGIWLHGFRAAALDAVLNELLERDTIFQQHTHFVHTSLRAGV